MRECWRPNPRRRAAGAKIVWIGDEHKADVGRLHVLFRRENPTTEKQDFELLPKRTNPGRYIGALIDDGRLQLIAARGDRFELVASYRVAAGDTYAPPVPLPNGFLVKDLKRLTFWSLTPPVP